MGRAQGAFEASGRFAGVARGVNRLFLEGHVYRLSNTSERLAADVAAASVLEALEERGPEAFADMVGDFVACAIVGGRTYAFKSFTSQYQLFVAGERVANRLAPLAGPAPSFDEGYFARHVRMVPGLRWSARRTPIRGVERVLPGELVTIDHGVERRALVTRRWRYRLDRGQRREDVAPAITDCLDTVIGDQLAARGGAGVTVELSGGLDSSFVACLVGRARPGTRAVMFSRPDLPSHRQSEDYARSVADRYGLELVMLPPSALPREPTLSSPPYADEPSDFFWFGDLFSRAVASLTPPGGVVFTGFGADQLFLRSPTFLPYLLAHREYRAFARALRPAGRLLARSPLHLALQSLLSRVPRGLYYAMARPFAGRRFDPFFVADVNLNRVLYQPVTWLAGSAEQEAFDVERRDAERRLVGDGILCDDWGYFASPHVIAGPWFEHRGIDDASPYCDLRLLDLVYDQVSALLVHDFEGRYKELLREAQRGIVPEDLRARKNDMFVFNTFLTDYLRDGREELAAMLDEIDPGLVDRRGVQRAFEELGFGVMKSSTRSLIALFGYLAWQRAFRRRVASLDDRGTKTTSDVVTR